MAFPKKSKGSKRKGKASIQNEESLLCHEQMPEICDDFALNNKDNNYEQPPHYPHHLLYDSSFSPLATHDMRIKTTTTTTMAAASSSQLIQSPTLAAAERVAAATLLQQQQEQQQHETTVQTSPPKISEQSHKNIEVQPKKHKKQKKEDNRLPSLQAETASDSQQEQQQEAQAIPLSWPELSRHVMYDWSELGLGERSGSGAWNAALRTRFVRNRCGGDDDDASVPQLSSMECLYRVQNLLQHQHIPTILPPEGSFVLQQPHDPEKLQSELSSSSLEDDDNDDSSDNTEEARASATALFSATSIRSQMRDFYRDMVRQDMDDGCNFRRDLRFTSASELLSRMNRAEDEITCLAMREQAIRERFLAGDTAAAMQLRVARLRGKVQMILT